MRAEATLLALHLALLGWLVTEGLLGGAYGSSWSGRGPRTETRRTVVHTPAGHLPLRGMPGFSGGKEDACLRMEGFVTTAVESLGRTDVPPPLPVHQVPALVRGTSCSVDDPRLVPRLRELDAAWRRAGLAPVGPLGAGAVTPGSPAPRAAPPGPPAPAGGR